MTGDLLIFPEREGSVDVTALSRLWSAAGEHDAVFLKRSASTARRNKLAARTMSRSPRWKSSARRRYLAGLVSARRAQAREPASLQLVRREVLERLGWIPLERGELMAALASRGYHWIEMRPEAPVMHSYVAAGPRGDETGRTGQPGREVQRSLHPRRPNYFDQIKRFALGE